MFLWLHRCYCMKLGFQERKKIVRICFKRRWFLWAAEPPKEMQS